jgi:RHS repeat-associated protein
LGTAQQLVGKSGAKDWEGEYRAFGEIVAETGGWENRLRFPGQYYDQETGNYYNYNRYYDGNNGRYTRSDPMGITGGINRFVYVDNNPINYIDIYGLAKSCFDKNKCKDQAVDNYKECLSDSKGYCAFLVGRCAVFYKNPTMLAICVAAGSATCVLGPCFNNYQSDSTLCELTRGIDGYDDYIVPDDACCPE